MEVLDKLNSGKFLPYLVFCGGTMLRLCYGMDRFSIDLDFHLQYKADPKKLFIEIKDFLQTYYRIKDVADKFHTMLYEIGSPEYRRGLKIEIRKTIQHHYEKSIAYSPYCDIQVLLNTVSLEDMMKTKIETFLDRCEVRDAFDIEFLLKKGVKIYTETGNISKLKKTLDSLTEQDFKVKLFPLLSPEKREYYLKEGFKILRMTLEELK